MMLSDEEKLQVQKSLSENRPVRNNPSVKDYVSCLTNCYSKTMIVKACLLPILMLYMVTSSHGVLPCKLRVHLARAEQTDEHGRKCWDTVKVPACGGRCDSREISDWEFPFKKSHHPVCVFGGRRPLMVRLRHCDPGVAMGTDVFHYIAAEDCRCKVCSSEYTSCEWLPPNSTLLDGIYDFEDLDEE